MDIKPVDYLMRGPPLKTWPPRKYVARVWIWKANLSIAWCNANVCWPQTKMTDQIWRSWIDFMICSITSPRNLSWKRASWNLAWENNWRGWPSTPGPCSFRCISPDSTMSQAWQQLWTSYRRNEPMNLWTDPWSERQSDCFSGCPLRLFNHHLHHHGANRSGQDN